MGGEDSTLGDLIYLDISKSFIVDDTQSEWQNVQLKGGFQAENNYGYGMGVIPEENSIMVYGGEGDNTGEKFLENTVILYNATENRWLSLPDPQAALLKQV